MARPLRKANVRLLGVVRQRRPALLVSTALCATVTMVVSLPAVAQPAPNARPTGGAIVGGSASISQTARQTTINQSTQRGAINWQSFNVGSQQSVQFNQPSSSAVTLNKVQGPNPSQIAGRIDANGQIIIENQSGVVFYKGSQVNTAGLMVTAATSGDAATRAFINGGKLALDQAANPNAAVVNQGQITVKQAGLAALVAPQVVNSGVITAKLGHVVLAGASKATLDLYGDGMLSVDVTGQVVQAPNGATALVTNSGLIVADGGSVQLTARAADGLVTTLVDAGGKIRAATVGSHTGTVTLNGVGGSVIVTGQLDATGTAPGTVGGSIAVNATGNVTVASGARIDASGKAGGGLVAIGTTLKRAAGGPGVTTTHTAASVIVQQGAVISANATRNGNGGRVTVLSTGTTTMNGLITATGGPQGGNGGFVELSGGNVSSGTGLVDVSAPSGTIGSILLDPDNLDIVASGGNLDGSFTGTVTTGQDVGSTDSLSGSVLDGFTGNVLLQAKLGIDVQSSFSIHAGSLTMEAGQLISVDSGVNVGALGDIILATGGAGPGTPPAAVANPMISIVGGVASSSGSVSLLAGAGGAISIADTGLVQAASGKSVTLQGDSMAFNNGKVSAPGGTIEIAPATSGNAVTFSGTGAGTLTVPALQTGSIVASTLRIGAATIGGTETTTAGAITFDKSVNLTGIANTLDLETTGAVTDTASSVLTVGTLTGNAAAGLFLNAVTNNSINTVGTFSGGPAFVLNVVGGVTIAGPVVATTIQVDNDDNNPLSVTGSLGATSSINMFTQGTMAVATSATLHSPVVTLDGVRGIELNGSAVVGQAGGIVDLSAFGGNVTEAGIATINAGTLQSQIGVSGTADLRGTANAIGTIGSFAAGGDFLLTDTTGLTIGNALSAGGSIYLQTSNITTGITIGAGGSVAAGSGSLVSFQADKFTNSGTVSGGTFELAPNTSGGTVTLGTTGSGLSLASLSGIGPTQVRIGAVTLPGGSSATTTAGSIVVAGAFGSSGVALELDSNGGIDGSGGVLTTNILTGSAGGDANFSAANAIAALGKFVVTNGGRFNLLNAGSIGVTGSVSAANATITAGTIGVSGSIVAPGSLDLTSSAGGIGLTGTALLNGGTVTLSSHTGITEASTSTILATDLSASAGAGGIVLDSLTNAIGTVTGLIASGGGVTLVVDPTLVLIGTETGDNVYIEVAHNGGTVQIGSITTPATISATAASNPTVTFVADNITEVGAGSTITATDGSNGGIVEIAPFTSGTPVFLGGTFGASGLVVDQTLLGDIDTGTHGLLRIGDYTTGSITAGNITIAGAVNLGAGTAATLELDSGGSITEPASLSLAVTTLTGTAAGGVALLGTTNAVGTLAAFTAGGNFALVDAPTTDLVVNGPVSGTGVAITGAGTTTIDAGVTATAGTVFVSSGSIALDAGGVLSGGIVDINSSAGGITEAGGGSIVSNTLQSSLGSTGNVDLGSANSVGTLANFIVNAGSFHLTDSGTSSLAVNGSVIAGSVTLDGVSNLLAVNGTILGTTGLVSLRGSGGSSDITLNGAAVVAGPTIDLNAGSIALNGSSLLGRTGALVDLTTTAGGVVEQSTATIVAATLQSSGGVRNGARLLGSNNAIAALGNFPVASGDLQLLDTGGLTVTGAVSAADVTITAGTISVSNSIFAIGGSLGLTATVAGIALDSGVVLDAATLDLSAPNGGVTEVNTGTIIASTLLSTQGVADTVTLLSNSNTIGTQGSFAVGALGDYRLSDTGSLDVTGPVSAADVTITAGTIGVSNSIFAIGGSLGLTATVAGIALDSGVVLDAATLDLSAPNGGVTEVNTGTIIASTLLSTQGVANTVTLLSNNNTIGTQGSFAVGVLGDYRLRDTGSLDVAGPVSAGNVTITAAAIGVGNSIVALGSLGLTATAAGIGLNNGGVLDATTLDLSAANGGVTEAAGAKVIAGTLESTLGVKNTVALLNNNNTIGALGGFTVTLGDFELVDSSNLLIAGAVSASDIFVKVAVAGGTLTLGNITTGATLTATVAPNPTISLVADNITEGSAPGAITATDGSVAIAPFSSGTPVSLGGVSPGGGTLVADGRLLADINTGTLRIGSYNDAANGGTGTITAGNISVDGPVSLNGHAATLLVNSLGSIVENGAGGIQVGTLIGTAAASVALTNANTIGTLAGFLSGGSFALVEANTTDLDVTGPVSATGVALSGAAVTTITTGVTATSGTVFVSSGSIALGGGGLLFGSIVDIDSSSGGITESGGGSIVAGTLLSSAGSTGNVDLGSANSVGTIAGFIVSGGTFHLDNSGTVGLTVNGSVVASSVTLDGVNGTLAVNSTILGTTGLVSITTVGPGSLIALNNGAVVAGPTIDLNSGNVVMAGAALLGQTGALLDVTTTGGGVNEAASATIVAGTLQSSGGITGDVNLAGTSNAIAALGPLTTFDNTFSLVDTGDLGVNGVLQAAVVTINDTGVLTVSGDVLAGNVNLTANDIAIPGLVQDGGGAGTTNLVATSGTIYEIGTLIVGTLNGSSVGATTLLGATPTTNQVVTLGTFSADGFTLRDGTPLTVAGIVSAGPSATILDPVALTVSGSILSTNAISLTGSSIAIPGLVSDGGSVGSTTTLTATSGAITETGTLIAGTLTGSSTGATSLTGATPTGNQVTTLGNFSSVGFTLDDGASLTVAGLLSAGPSATILGNGALTVSGSILSTNAISLTGSSIAIPGLVTDGGSGTTSLTATNGTISETGTLIAGTLSGEASNLGTVSTAVSLTGATPITNQIGTLGNFIASSFTLDDGRSLAVNGQLGDDASATITLPSTATLTINGTILPVVLSGSAPSSTNLSLTAGNIAIPGTVSDGGAGMTSLTANASGGTIYQAGMLMIGTLSGSSQGATALIGSNPGINQVGTIADFTAVGFTLNDGAPLTVSGALSAGPSATIFGGGSLWVTGSIVSSSAVSLTAGSITIPGLVTDGGAGTTSLIATNGTISETGTLIAGTLSGLSRAGGVADAVSLTGATPITNQIATLGNFTASSFTLNDGVNLTIAGQLGDDVSATITLPSTAALTVTGAIVPAALFGAGPNATNVSLTAGSIVIPGKVSDGGAGTTQLIANGTIVGSGMITETGTLIAGTLTGSSFAATNLLGATAVANQVANLGSFTAAEFALNDGAALAVAGPVNGGTSVTILDAAALTVNGSLVSSDIINLTGSSIAITGSGFVSDGGSGMTSLTATNGGITETGTLIAGTLTGSSTGATGLTGATITTNQVANLGSVTAANFTLDDGESLTVIAPVIANSGSVAIMTAGTLTNNSTIQANTSAFLVAATDITNNGSVIAVNNDASLTATAGTITSNFVSAGANAVLLAGTDITNSGSVIAVTSDASLTATAGTITTNFVSAGANARLFAGTNITNTGSVIAMNNDASLTATAGTITTNFVSAGANARLFAGTDITDTGSVIAVNNDASLTATAGTITTNFVSAGANARLLAGTNITNTGSVIAVTNDASLTATAGTITTNFVSAGANARLLAGTDITNTGSVIAINNDASLTARAGTITSNFVSGGVNAVLLAGTDITNTGSVIAINNDASLTATTGTITTNFISAGHDAALLARTDITNVGSVIAPNGDVFATATAGTITSNFINAGDYVLLLAGTNITNTGSVIAVNNDASLTATAGTITSNFVSAGGIAALVAGTNITNTGSVIALTNDASLTATAGTITNNFVSAGGNATLVAGTNIFNTLVDAGGNATLSAGGGIINSGVFAGDSASLTAATLDITDIGSGVTAATGSASLTATLGNIAESGGVSAGTTSSLTAGNNITQSARTISAAGSGVTLVAQGGTIGQLAGAMILASNPAGRIGLTTKALDIDVAGTIAATGALGVVNLTANGAINQTAGLIAAGSTGDTISAGTPSVTLVAQTGTIAQAGGAAILANDNAGAIAVTAVASSITTSGTISAGGAAGGTVNLEAGTSITQAAGTILAGGPGVISAAGPIAPNLSLIAHGGTIAQSAGALISAPAGVIELLASGNIRFSGEVSAPGSAGGVAMISGGTIGEISATGILQAGTLIGSAANGATLVAASGTGNLVANLGTFVTGTAGSGSFVLVDDESLTVLDPVIANAGSIAITATNFGTPATSNLTNDSTIQAATSVALVANNDLTNTGSVVAQAGDASLTAIGGALTNGGLILASANALLTAGTDLGNTGSVIAQGGNASLTATGGALTNGGLVLANANALLTAGTDLGNTGSVIARGGNASLTATGGALTNGGLIVASANALLTAGTDLGNTGSVIAQGGNASLTATGGALTNGGLILATANALLTAGTDLGNTGSVIAQGGNASLTAMGGALTNGGLILASANALLTAGTDLGNTGSVIAQGGNASLTATGGALTNGGLILAAANALLTAGTDLGNTGSVIAQGGNASLTATGGALTNGGLILASANALLTAGTDLGNTGSVIAQGGNASLTATEGALTNGGLILASANALLTAGTDLGNTGSVIAQGGNASLTATRGALTNGGLILASANATLLGDLGVANTGSVIAQTGNAALTATAGTLFNSGLISAATAGSVVALNALAGPIVQFGATGSIIAGGQVDMNAAGGITLDGLVKDDLGVILNAGGTIFQDGMLIADLLTGSAAGAVNLMGATGTVIPIANQVANLGSFTAGGSFALNDGADLLISGVISAATITIHDGNDTISLGNAGIVTGGAVRPPGAIPASRLPPSGITTQGAYLYAGNVIETGSSFTVTNLPGTAESILSIILPQGGHGTLQFTPGTSSSNGLLAANTWLILGIGEGRASGAINVKAFDFLYNPPPGGALFTGTVNGDVGQAAAAAAFILPSPNSNYRINNCPIHSVTCLLLSTEGVPTNNPINDITLGAPLNTENPEDLVLPVVSDERYELVPCDDPNAPQGCPALNLPPSSH